MGYYNQTWQNGRPAPACTDFALEVMTMSPQTNNVTNIDGFVFTIYKSHKNQT